MRSREKEKPLRREREESKGVREREEVKFGEGRDGGRRVEEMRMEEMRKREKKEGEVTNEYTRKSD